MQFGEVASPAVRDNYVHAEEHDEHKATILFVPLKHEIHLNSPGNMISIKPAGCFIHLSIKFVKIMLKYPVSVSFKARRIPVMNVVLLII